MDVKKIGLIALIVLAVGVAVWAFKQSFMNGTPPAGPAEAAKWRAIMQERGRQGQAQPQGRPGERHSPSTAGQ